MNRFGLSRSAAPEVVFDDSAECIHLHEIELYILMDVLHAQGKLPEEFGGEDYIPEKYLIKAWEEAGRLKDQSPMCSPDDSSCSCAGNPVA